MVREEKKENGHSVTIFHAEIVPVDTHELYNNGVHDWSVLLNFPNHYFKILIDWIYTILALHPCHVQTA